MADFMSRASLAGAVDLSSLKKQPPSPGQAVPPVSQNPVAKNPLQNMKVPDLLAMGTDQNLKNFVEISQTVPVVIDFFADDLELSKVISAKLETAVRALGGKIFLLRVDTKTQFTVAQAFAVKEVPTVAAMIMGQPIPLFTGNQTDEDIKAVLDRLLQVAMENGVSGRLEISEEFSQGGVGVSAALPVHHQAAYDAIEADDYEGAVIAYQKALSENPADALAVAGLAQAKLLVRTKNADFETVLASTPTDFDSTVAKADACVAVGQSELGYQTILTRFSVAEKEERERLRHHLLELFQMAAVDAPEVAMARRTLAALLY